MPTITTIEGVYIPLPEAVAGALTDKDDQLLSLNASGQAVLFDGTSPAFAVHAGKLSPDSGFVKARLLGAVGTARVVQDAAIAIGTRVAGKTGTTRVQTAVAGQRALGIKLGPSSGAQGDVIEIAVLIEPAAVPSVVAAPAATALTATSITELNSTAVNPTKADFDALLAVLATLVAEHRADNAKLIATHSALVAQGVVAVA